MPITKFVSGSRTYNFPVVPGDQEYSDNFKSVVARSSRIPGADGSIDEYGSGRAPSAEGIITFGIVLMSPTRQGMLALRESLAKIREWDYGQLFFQPLDLTLPPRWVVCRLSKMTMPEQRQENTDLWQPVQLTFQAPDPHWYTEGNQELWDGSGVLDGGAAWDGPSFTTVTGSGTLSITPTGNALTLGRFVARVTGAQTFHQLAIRRLINGGIVDQMVLQMELVTNDVMEFDPRHQWVLVNGISQIDNFESRHPDWLRLLPELNSIQITLDESTAAISAKILYFDRYI